MTIDLCLTPDDRWEIERDELIAASAAAGFVGLGMYRKWVDETTKAALATNGLRCDEMLALIVTDDIPRTTYKAERLSEAAAAVGASWILTVLDTAPTTGIVELVRRCADIMAGAGTAMAVEFTPLGPLDTIDAGLEMAAAAGGGAKLVVDSWHVCLGPTTWADLERLPLDQIAYVQFDDALQPISNDLADESTNRRALPGTGMLDLERFATTLLERGWEGVVSVEVLGENPGIPVSEFVRRCHGAAERYWR